MTNTATVQQFRVGRDAGQGCDTSDIYMIMHHQLQWHHGNCQKMKCFIVAHL